MLIRCPNCDTAYHVGEEQLRESGGQAVCCRCNEVFEAEIYKIPDDTELLNHTLHDAKQDADEWQPDASLFENIDDEDGEVEDIDISSLIEESIAQGELPLVSDELDAVLDGSDFSAEKAELKKVQSLKEKQEPIKNKNDETLYGDTNFSGIPPDSVKNAINKPPKEENKNNNVDHIFNQLNDSQLQEDSFPIIEEDVVKNKTEKTDSSHITSNTSQLNQQSKSTSIEDDYLVDESMQSSEENINTKQTESSQENSQLDAINFNDVKAENLTDDSFTNPSIDDLDNLGDLTDQETGYQLDSFSDEIPLKENKKNKNDFDFSVEEEPVKKPPPKQFKKPETVERNHEIDDLGELLDTITKEVVQKETSFQVDEEEFSDLLDNMDSQGLLDEDSALITKEDTDSDLSYLTDNTEDYTDSNLNIESIVEPLIGQSDRTIESNSYFAASSEIAIETMLPIKRYKRKIWLTRITSFLFVLLLITQVAWFKQKDIVKFPLGHQLFEKSCALLGCKVPNKVDLEKIKIIKKSFKEHAFIPHALEVTLVVKNTAKFEQPYPKLKITLLNNHKTKISQRVFNKEEYLHQKTNNLMPINKPIIFSLIIEEKGRRATTFNADFY